MDTPDLDYTKTRNESFINAWIEFSSESKNMANALANGFNRKKKAFAMKNSNRKSVGKIDMHALWKYKTHDDVFVKKTFMPKGKSHACYILLDWSGSMGGKILPMVKQAIVFAEFCKKSKIPYRIYAFTSQNVKFELQYGNAKTWEERSKINNAKYEEIDRRRKRDISNTPMNCMYSSQDDTWGTLVEFFSDKMDEKQFQIAKRRLFAIGYSMDYASKESGGDDMRPGNINSSFSLGGTPLNSALMSIRPIIRKHMRANNIQNPNLIILTDGQSGRVNYTASGYADSYTPGTRVFVDSKTNKSFRYSSKDIAMYTETEVCLKFIKLDGIRVIGYYIADRAKSCIENGVDFMEGPGWWKVGYEYKWKPISGSHKEGYAMMPSYGGFDNFYVIDHKKIFKHHSKQIKFDVESLNTDMTSGQIRSKYKKANTDVKYRKFLANSLVDTLVASF